MSFGDPAMLNLTAITAVVLGLFLYWTWRRRQEHIRQFVRGRLLAQLTVGVSTARQKLRLLLLVAAVAAAMFSLARPQWGYAWEEIRQHGLDIVVAVDTSRSMLAEDIAPNRLTRAKLAALELAGRAKTDRLGLVAFAGTAFLQCPLTLDDDAYRQNVNTLAVGLIPQGGTALGEAITTALTAFKNDGDNPKVVVLMTDGEDHEEGALAAAQAAAKTGAHLFTIGIGTTQGDMLRTITNGASSFIKDTEGNVVKSHLNEAILEQLASVAGGFYLPLRGANTMELLYQRGLAPLLGSWRQEGQALPAVKRPHERFQWFLGLAILLLIVEMFLPYRRLVLRPEQPAPMTTSRELAGMTGAVLLLLLPLTARASPSKAWHLYESGQYQPAWQEYQRELKRHPRDLRLAFNAGVAAYQAKAYEEAAGLFSDTLIAPDLSLQERAYYNLGNTQYRLGEQAAEPQQKSAAWEQALRNYDDALKLNAQDADAKFNRDYVKKQLDELKKQQQKQPESQQNKSDQNKSDQNEPPKPDQSKQDQSKKGESKPEQNKPDQQKQDQPKPDQSKQEQAKKQPKPAESKKDEAKNEPSKPQPQPKEPAGPTNQTGAAESAALAGKMTPEQARQLLDMLKNEERVLLYLPPELREARPRSLKDW